MLGPMPSQKSSAASSAYFAEAMTPCTSEWEYASGTYRAEPTRVRHQVRVMDVDGECVAAEGEFAEPCLEAMRKCLTENLERINRRGGEVGSNDPLDVGFDPSTVRDAGTGDMVGGTRRGDSIRRT